MCVHILVLQVRIFIFKSLKVPGIMFMFAEKV